MNQSRIADEEKGLLNRRILQYYDEAMQIHHINSSGEGVLPYPKMAFIFPTYQCSLNCKNCMYKNYIRKYKKNSYLDLDLDLLKHILDDLSRLGVNNVEITGGGEPLEHREVNHLIRLIHHYSDKIDFSLLSNGINLNRLEEDTFRLLMESCSYIRLSYSEATSQNMKLTRRYLENLKNLLEDKIEGGYKVRIGAKLLLTRKNKNQIPHLVDELYHLGVEHLKVKSKRSLKDEPTTKDIIEVERRLYEYKYTSPVKEVLEIDLRKTDYPEDFHCWINPLSTTINPQGHIYICYNYHNSPQNMRIGTYTRNNSLTDFWGKPDHLEKIRNINIQKVCKAHNACNCRFADYQKLIEKIKIDKLKTDEDIGKTQDEEVISRFL